MSRTYIFSTLANDQMYQDWTKGGGDIPVKGRGVLIKGGAGVANRNLITPLGVATEVSDEELQLLEANEVFQTHKKLGFVVVRQKSADPEKVAADMNRADRSAPLTEASFPEAEGAIRVTLNKA